MTLVNRWRGTNGPRWSRRAAAFGLVCAAISCDSGGHGAAPAVQVAQRCVSIQADRGGGWLRVRTDGGYGLEATADGADRFFVKPSGLGKVLLYDQGGGFLGAAGEEPKRLLAPDDSAEWTLAGRTIENATLGGSSLSVVLRADADCRPFPEAALDAVASTASGEPSDPARPVLGFADLHAHLGFPSVMGGVVMAGSGFHRFGIEHALGDCAYLHGAGGALDFLESQVAGGQHATAGYPSFPYWPSRGTATHVVAYWRWIERAHLAGLELIVTHATGNRSYCQIMKGFHPERSGGDCSAHDEVGRQLDYVYELQDYVDAQAGGAGLGWFRIVRSPAEARQVIAQGKLAVVLGAEYSELFDCRESNAGCTPDYVDAQLQALYDRGVRSVFPIHRFDNAFGGTLPGGGSFGAWMNLTSKISTSPLDSVWSLFDPFERGPIGGHFQQMAECPEGAHGTQMRSMQAFVDEDLDFVRQVLLGIPVIGPPIERALTEAIRTKLVPLDDYADFQGEAGGCNPRGLTEVGRHLIERMMDLGMIVEIDHVSQATLGAMLGLAEARGYSGIISAHDWIDNSEATRQRIFALGGLMSPIGRPPASAAEIVARYQAEMARYPYVVGVGIGTDVQGIASLSGPEPAARIEYPFTSFDGTVTFTRPRTGERSFDFDTEGMAHYGLFPEWVEALRQVSAARGDGTIDTFFRSAEAYLQMWERAEAARPASAPRR